MRIAIGSDHAGFPLKEEVKAFLHEENQQVLDVGTYSKDPVDYSDYSEAVGAAVRESRAERGILFCGVGARPWPLIASPACIRAGLCHDTYSAHQGVEHDHMNVLVLGGRVVGIELAREPIRAFLNANSRRRKRARDAKTLYEKLAVRDIQDAADALLPVYEETSRRDGYVSLEVSPFLAHDTAGTLDEARRL